MRPKLAITLDRNPVEQDYSIEEMSNTGLY